MKHFQILLLALIPALFFTACEGNEEEETKGPIVVASKIDTEGALLGNMLVQVLENDGFEVRNRTEFGQTDIIRSAIINGEIDIYPEYTGNGAFFYDQTGDDVWKDPEQAWQRIRELDIEEHNIVWLQPASANNTWAIAAQENVGSGLETMEDFAEYVNSGGEVLLACSEEFVSRPDVLPAFEEAYGFSLSEDQLLILSGGNTATTEQAAARGTDGVNFAMAYGTDGQLAALGLVVLEDTRNVQPVYQPAPIIRKEVLDEYPEIQELLEPVFESLDLETLQELNSQIAVEGRPAPDVAEEYLKNNNFIE
ncbi:MAG: ABC transporter substrate-binding protein [Spirochaetia bacterium]